MNKILAIAGSIAGAISAGVLMMGMSSVDSVAHRSGCSAKTHSAVSSRELNWNGTPEVDIKVPALVHFTVAPTWRAVATGPSEALQRLQMNGGELEFESSYDYCGDDLRIELQGPAVRSWSLRGSGDLLLEGLNQDVLDIYVAGSGSTKASGTVRETRVTIKGSGDVNVDELVQQRLELDIHGSGSASARGVAEQSRIAIYGSGNAYFDKLEVNSAKVRIHGSGDVRIAPIDSVEALIYGSGSVRLLSSPKQVRQQIRGLGGISELRG